MGSRKHIMAEQYKAEKKQKAIAILNDCPTSPLKMRIVADTIRGVEINRALGMLRFSKKAASIKLEKLLRSAIANWEQKNEGQRLEDNKLCVSRNLLLCPLIGFALLAVNDPKCFQPLKKGRF